MKKIIAIISLIIFIVSCSCESSPLTTQERAVQNKDWQECKKASMPDVCLLGYAKGVNDRSVCSMITDAQFKEMCHEIPCGRHNQVCCFTNSKVSDSCDSPARCFGGTCYSCGLIGMSSCMLNDGELCHEGTLTIDNECE